MKKTDKTSSDEAEKLTDDDRGRKKTDQYMLELQSDLAKKLIAVNDFYEALSCTLDAAVRIDSADSGCIYIIDENDDLYLSSAVGLSDNFSEKLSFFRNGSQQKQYLTGIQSKSIDVNNLPDFLKNELAADNINCAAIFPIIYNNNIIAVMMTCSHEYPEISDRAVQIIESIAAQTGNVMLRLRNETSLKKMDDQYRSFVSDFKGIVFRGDLEFKPVFMHGDVETITGYREEDFSGGKLTWDSIIYEEDFHRIANGADYEKLFSTGKDEREYRIVRRDGTVKWIRENVHMINDSTGKPAGVQGVFIDIGDRKKAEYERERALSDLDQIFNTIHIGICLIDENYNILNANHAFGKIFNVDIHEISGKKCHEVMNEASCKTLQCPLLNILNGEKYYQFETEKQLGDGSKIICDIIGTPFYNPGGDLIGILETFTDITEIRNLEKQLIQVSENERRIIGQDIHDELGQLLTGISFLIKTVEKKISRYTDEKISEIDDIAALVKKTTVQSRHLSRGLYPVYLESEGLISAVREMASAVESIYNMKCRVREKGSFIIDDAFMQLQIYRIIQESVNNAVKHGDSDEIEIEFSSDQKNKTITIADNGIGLDNGKDKGSGMGLSIMKYRSDFIGAQFSITELENGGVLVKIVLNDAYRPNTSRC